ncbi:MAG TPA: GIY-YIG nuclease family protein [Desulfobacteraceae bacterium]|nr:GIY-YIG nuclease family protein [Desulfobacteraceae bacterium]
MYYVYLLRSIPHPDRTYIGFSKDVRSLLNAHNLGQYPYTGKFKPWKLLTYIPFVERQKALDFEKYLKSHSGKAFAKKRL